MSRRTLTIKSNWSPGKRMGLGLAAALLAQLLALFLAGAGHGWVSPTWASILLWIAFPAAFALAWPGNVEAMQLSETRPLLLSMAVIGLLADAWLIKSTIDEVGHLLRYLQINGAVGYAIAGSWLTLWLICQVLVARALLISPGTE